MSLRRLVFVKTWYILQSRLGGSSKFIHVYLIYAILSACEACKNISLHEACEKNALWSCAVRLPALLNAVCGFNIVAHTEAKLYSAVMFYRFYRCQNFGTQRFLQKRIAFRTRSNPGRIISSALCSAATGWPGWCRSNRMDLFQVALKDTQSEPPRSHAILERKGLEIHDPSSPISDWSTSYKLLCSSRCSAIFPRPLRTVAIFVRPKSCSTLANFWKTGFEATHWGHIFQVVIFCGTATWISTYRNGQGEKILEFVSGVVNLALEQPLKQHVWRMFVGQNTGDF